MNIISTEARGQEQQGKPLIAVIPLENSKLLGDLEDKLDIIEAKKAKREIPRKGTKPLRKLIKELKL